MMKCIVKEKAAPGNIVLTERPIPEIGDSDILVKVLATALCGSDLHIEEWNEFMARRVKPPMIIGHEFAGEVVKAGSKVTSVKVGDIVSAETHIVCNTCQLCRNGHRHVCLNTSTIGVHRDGSFAQYIAIPAENACVCDPNVSPEILSLMEPLGAAVHTVMEFPVAAKDVAVIGCGPIGTMAVAVAKKVIAIDPNEKRAAMAKELGADYIVNPSVEDPVERVKALTNGLGVDVVLEFSGSVPAIKTSLNYIKLAGRISALGLPSTNVDFDFSEFVYRGLQLHGIAGRLMYQTWEQMNGLLASGLDVSKVVTHVLPMSEFEKGFELMRKGECSKVILKPWE